MSEIIETKTPKWRKDFPIEWSADNYVTRREFTKFLVLASGAACVGNGYFVLRRLAEEGQAAAPSVAVASHGEIPVGGVKLFRYPTEDSPALLIRVADTQYAAYLQRCTHLSCPVMPDADGQRLECPCHNGAFDAATGRVLSGPPPRPLPRIALRIEGDKILAEGLEPEA
ncbi:MAG: Rieske (2Fe-2S) protein [Armatimonadota bacterium]|nr:Rieske (2Fe-2S) protein [Armatimonadota bacterium]